MQEARRAGVHALPELACFEVTRVGSAALGGTRATVETSVTETLAGATAARRAAALALSLLCEAHAARAGYLYLVGEDGLALAATLAAEAPDALEGLVTSFWNQCVEEPEMPTAFIADGPPAEATSNLWTDSRGTAYEAIPMSCVIDGVSLHVGIAVLIPGSLKPRTSTPRTSPARSASTWSSAATLAAYLPEVPWPQRRPTLSARATAASRSGSEGSTLRCRRTG